jgi:hypothetical protein
MSDCLLHGRVGFARCGADELDAKLNHLQAMKVRFEVVNGRFVCASARFRSQTKRTDGCWKRCAIGSPFYFKYRLTFATHFSKA